jgi:peptide/nickel transport system substrate-binding protein
LKKPDATFLNVLALPFAYAVPREHVEKLEKEGKTLSEHPNGCGPFRLAEWVHDAWLTLERNPKYFRPNLPQADKIQVQMGNSAALQIMRLSRGKSTRC